MDALPLAANRLDPHAPGWHAAIDHIGARLRAGDNPTLFPYHFLQVVLPKLGGHIVVFRQVDREVGVGFLLPRLRAAAHAPLPPPAGARAYTLRYHAYTPAGYPTPALAHAAIAATRPLLHDAQIVFYDPTGPLRYAGSEQLVGSVSIGRPTTEEAAQIPALHQRIWGSPPEFLYPADMHSVEFQLGTSLVARVEGQLAAFLFGFTKFDGPDLPADWATRFRGDLRLESQTMGVLPDFRGMRIANLLKRVQADHAQQAGIAIINWTADPLQFPNAALNFGLLRAVAFHYYPDFYPFRNDLNRVPASRFGLTWLVNSARVQNVPLLGARAPMLDLPQHPEIQRVNQGHDALDLAANREFIAVEIPGDWTGLQQRAVGKAMRWREATDRLFSHYVGIQPGQYVITGVATDRDQRFLIGQRVDDALWGHLGHVESDAPPLRATG